MSATNRGAERADLDFYATPEWCVKAVLPYLKQPIRGNGKPRTVLDPGCGDGAIMSALRNVGWGPDHVAGVELDAGRADKARQYGRVLCFDFLNLKAPEEPTDFDLVVGNPPYSLALEFVRHSMLYAPQVAMLLRLNWLEGRSRAEFHKEHPAHVCVLPKRPSFTGKGTDATGYAWFIWGNGRAGRWDILDIE